MASDDVGSATGPYFETALDVIGRGIWKAGDEPTIAACLMGESGIGDDEREAFIARCPEDMQAALRDALPVAVPDAEGLHRIIREADEWNEAKKPRRKAKKGRNTFDPLKTGPRDNDDDRPTVNELVDAMKTDELLNLSIGINELEGVPFVTAPTPWDATGEERRWTDADLSNLYAYMQGKYRRAARADVIDALTILVNRRRYNPLTIELRSLAKAQRGLNYAPHLLAWFVGADDDRYSQQVTLAWMRCAVARAFRPGIMAQWMPVLYGPQGCGKSHFSSLMALHPRYFTDSVSDLSNIKTTAEALAGKWIAEVAELDGMRGKDLEAVKATITRTDDVYRASYGRYAKSHPRRSVFIGSTNKRGFLRDRTGNRRFYPVTVGVNEPQCDMRDEDAVMPIVREAWGEVVAQYLQASAKARTDADFLRLFPMEPPADVREMAERERGASTEANDNAETISAWLARLAPGIHVCAAQVAKEALGIETDKYAQNRRLQHEVNEIMDTMPGWHRCERKQRCNSYGLRRCWEADAG